MVLKQKKLRSDINNILKANKQCDEALERILKTYPLHTQDEVNLLTIQEHLNNMSVVFSKMLEQVNASKH